MFDPWYDVFSALPLALINPLTDQAVKLAALDHRSADDDSLLAALDGVITALTALHEDDDENEAVLAKAQTAIRWVGTHLNALDCAADISREYGQTLVHWGAHAMSYEPNHTYEEWTAKLNEKGQSLLAYANTPEDKEALSRAQSVYHWSADNLPTLWD